MAWRVSRANDRHHQESNASLTGYEKFCIKSALYGIFLLGYFIWKCISSY
jgi:hypothetical protein